MIPDANSTELIHKAQERAAALVDALVRRQTDLQANWPGIDAALLAHGRRAMHDAVEAARKTLLELQLTTEQPATDN